MQSQTHRNGPYICLKKLFNVSPRTPNDMVYGETGRYPLYICAYVSCIKYWLRLTRMDETRFPRKAYSMLLLLHENGKFCWASQVRKTLYEHGFGIVWNQQGVQSPNVFLKVFKQRLIDCHGQNWHAHINRSDRFDMYKTFKSSIFLESYFSVVTNKHIRDVLVRFRLGISELRAHK